MRDVHGDLLVTELVREDPRPLHAREEQHADDERRADEHSDATTAVADARSLTGASPPAGR